MSRPFCLSRLALGFISGKCVCPRDHSIFVAIVKREIVSKYFPFIVIISRTAISSYNSPFRGNQTPTSSNCKKTCVQIKTPLAIINSRIRSQFMIENVITKFSDFFQVHSLRRGEGNFPFITYCYLISVRYCWQERKEVESVQVLSFLTLVDLVPFIRSAFLLP